MPSPTNYTGLKIKIGLVFSLLIYPFLFYYSIQAIFIKDPVIEPIQAKVIGYSEFDRSTYLRVEKFSKGVANGTVIMSINPDDMGKYGEGQEVFLARDPFRGTADARLEYVFYEEYVWKLKMQKVGFSGVILLPFLLFGYYKFRTRKKGNLALPQSEQYRSKS